MKKYIYALAAFFLLFACTGKEEEAPVVKVQSIAIEQSDMTLTEGESVNLSAKVLPENVADKTVNWSSSNESVVLVSSNGKAMAMALGKAIITAKSGDKSDFMTITVEAKVIPVTGVSLDKTQITIKVGESETLTPTITPEDATNKTLYWTSSDETVATVNQNGRVSAKEGGETIIKAAIGNFYAECKVTVTVPVSSVSLNKSQIAIVKGETFALTATVNPDNATDKTVSWKSSNSSVASVVNGVVTANMTGQATITASSGGKSATCAVSVTTPVTSVSLDRFSITLEEKQSTILVATVSPNDADDKTVIWSSSDSNVATVDQSGMVTAMKEGVTTIKAQAGGKSATCAVTVRKETIPVSSVVLNQTSIIMRQDETFQLVATVNPANATDRTIEWSCSNPDVAIVTNGLIKAIKEGTAIIMASAGDKSAMCTVTVSNAATGGIEGTDEDEFIF